MEEKTNLPIQELVRSVLTSEVKFVLGIIVFVGGIAAPYYGIKQDISLIQSNISNINANHEVHIQDLTQEIKDLNSTQNEQQSEILDLQKQLIRLIGK